MNKHKELSIILKDLKKIYKTAMHCENLKVAIQAQKAIMDVIKQIEIDNISLSNLTKDQIEQLIKESEESQNEITAK